MAQPAQVIVVDDHAVVRNGIAAMLDPEEGIRVIGYAANGREAVDQARVLAPDVVLIDLRMPELNGVEAMRELLERDPDAKCIVLTTFDTDEYIFDAIDAGAKGFLLKDTSRDELIRAILAVSRGESLINPSVAARVLTRFTALSRGEHAAPPLSDREMEVLRQVAKGLPNKGIAAALTISESTVKTHVVNILQKLEASSRTEAATKAVQLGLVKL